jgi:hypothetical protein
MRAAGRELTVFRQRVLRTALVLTVIQVRNFEEHLQVTPMQIDIAANACVESMVDGIALVE